MQQTITQDITHFHLFCGLGGGARGFNNGQARVGNYQARFRCIGGVDVDPASIADFTRLAGVPGTVLDMFSRDQYIAFHGKEPPADWREATPFDIQMAAGGEHPNILFLSAPCKGFSGLLSETRSKTDKYQALNALTLRGMWLALEAWKNDPIELIVFENVPRIATRGRKLLDQIIALLHSYGYAVAETTHDCGELGGLAQSRKRFLLVARHIERVPPFLYEPEKRNLRAVGQILDRMPLPGAAAGGAMHRVPSLQWKTWVRLAFVEAGSDWRSLNKLKVEDGMLADYLIMPECHNGHMGVTRWDETAGTVAGCSRPGNGKFSVADPRLEQSDKWPDGQAFGLRKWDQPTGTVTSKNVPGQGPYSVADPRPVNCDRNGSFGVIDMAQNAGTVAGETFPSNGKFAVADPRHHGTPKHSNEYRIVPWDREGKAVTGAHGTGHCVADPRGLNTNAHHNVMHITTWDKNCKTITSSTHPAGGAMSVADPRPKWEKRYGNLQVIAHDQVSSVVHGGGKGVQGGALSVADPRGGLSNDSGKYKVTAYDAPAGTVIGGKGHGACAVADPRMPAADERMVAVIRALDGTWHRPFTTLELAALQSLVEPEEHLELEGLSDSAWRERIGNAVPPAAAEAIAGVMGTTLLQAWSGQTFTLGSTPIWVRNIAIGLSVHQGEQP